MTKTIKILILTTICTFSFATQNIEIIGGNKSDKANILIVNFENDPNEYTNPNNISEIISNDLNITDEFVINKDVDTNNNLENTYIITGKINKETNEIECVLTKNNSTNLLTMSINYNSDKVRAIAHQLSNLIYYKLTKTKGIFASKIAFITQENIKNKTVYKLIVADFDGYNQKIILSQKSPLSSIAWNETSTQIAYVSWDKGKPCIYVQNLYYPSRYLVANFNGSNSSPSFTKDNKLLVTLTKDNDESHIFKIKNLKFNTDSKATKIISFGKIDTEASDTKDNNIIFTSNHDGGPQIFLYEPTTQKATRLTVKLGRYNTSAKFAHNDNKITFINRNSGVLKAYVLDLDKQSAYPISETTKDIAPSFAPNDKLILFSSDGNLYISNVYASKQTKLENINASIIDQAWSNN